MNVEDRTLSTGCIRDILVKRITPKHPLIVQILETRVVQEDDNNTYYRMFVSDGDLGLIFTSEIKFNRLHSTGKLGVYTIIKIMKYKVEFHSSSSFNSEVSSFEILANGRDIKKIIGQPSNLPTEMRDWLSLYTIRLEKETILEKEAAKLELKCLNSSSNISKLSTGSLQKIFNGTKIENPIVQILSLVKITNAEENLIYYSINISDGQNYFHRVETQSFHFNNLVAAGIITRFAIIRLDKFNLFDNDTRINVTHVTVINKDVEIQIGENLVQIKLRKLDSRFDYKLRDKLVKDMKVEGSNEDLSLDVNILVDMQHGVPYSNPVLQIIKLHFNGPSLCQDNLEISDGFSVIFTEFLDIPFLNTLLILKNIRNAIVRIDEYELSFVRDTDEQLYKPIIHIIKMKFLTNPNISRSIKLIGKQILTYISIPIYHKGYKNFEEQPSISTQKKILPSALPEKSLLKKGFLCKPTTVEIPKEEDPIPSSNITETELQEKIRALTLQLKEHEENKAIAIENAKLKKKLENKKKNFSIKAQKLIENNLEIIGVQQKQNEDLKEIVDRIFTLGSISLNIDGDVEVIRSGPEIVIKCKNTSTKKIILDGMRGKELNSEELYLNIAKRMIFINQQLTPLNKLIYIKAKTLRDDGVFNFVLIRNGKVLVKTKSNGNKPIHICSMDQMKEYSAE